MEWMIKQYGSWGVIMAGFISMAIWAKSEFRLLKTDLKECNTDLKKCNAEKLVIMERVADLSHECGEMKGELAVLKEMKMAGIQQLVKKVEEL